MSDLNSASSDIGPTGNTSGESVNGTYKQDDQNSNAAILKQTSAIINDPDYNSIREFINDHKAGEYWNRNDPKYAAIVAKLAEPYKAIYGNNAVQYVNDNLLKVVNDYSTRLQKGLDYQTEEDTRLAAEEKKSHEDALASKALLKAFADRMMAPLDMNDPYVKQITQNSTASAQAQNIDRGLGTQGIAQSNVADIVSKNLISLQDSHQALGAQALGQIASFDQGQQGLNLNATQAQIQAYNNTWNAENAAAAAKYSSDKAGSQGLWSAIGGVGGAVIGGVAAYNMGGNPIQGASLGGSVGSGLGGGIAGATYGGYQTPAYNPPTAGSGGKNRLGNY